MIEHFRKRQGHEPQDVRGFMEKITAQLDQQHMDTREPAAASRQV